MPTDLDFLRELCSAPAPTGFEAPVQEVFRRRLAGIAKVDGDPLGNVWADTGGAGGPHIVLAAHADQIGLIVTYVDEQGFITFDKIGGLDAQLLPGRSLVIHTAGGPVPGVVGRRPSHKMSADERAKAPELSEQWLEHRCHQPRRRPHDGADRRPDHLSRRLRAPGQRAFRLAGLR